jgi:hypothetical protein
MIKNSKNVSICPACNTKARFYSVGAPGEDTTIHCEICNEKVRSGDVITRSVPPGIVLPMTLEVLDKFIKMEEENKDHD